MKNTTKKTYIVVGVVAAAVSAATAAYVFWARTRSVKTASESVEEILDRCQEQVRRIEQKLGEFSAAT